MIKFELVYLTIFNLTPLAMIMRTIVLNKCINQIDDQQVTKLDESISVGEIISTSIQNGLPIGYLTDGQRVPEDIKVANAEKLVALADKMTSRINHQHASTWRPMPKKEATTV